MKINYSTAIAEKTHNGEILSVIVGGEKFYNVRNYADSSIAFETAEKLVKDRKSNVTGAFIDAAVPDNGRSLEEKARKFSLWITGHQIKSQKDAQKELRKKPSEISDYFPVFERNGLCTGTAFGNLFTELGDRETARQVYFNYRFHDLVPEDGTGLIPLYPLFVRELTHGKYAGEVHLFSHSRNRWLDDDQIKDIHKFEGDKAKKALGIIRRDVELGAVHIHPLPGELTLPEPPLILSLNPNYTIIVDGDNNFIRTKWRAKDKGVGHAVVLTSDMSLIDSGYKIELPLDKLIHNGYLRVHRT